MNDSLTDSNIQEMGGRTAIVVTSIAAPNSVMKAIAQEAYSRQQKFYVIGDVKSPANFKLGGCEFYGIDAQHRLEFKLAQLAPTRHYARKNIGYLLAMRDGASIIIETDDDNMPESDFYVPLNPHQELSVVVNASWVNVYQYFTDQLIWPRGLPLDAVRHKAPELDSIPISRTFSPIQQGLANDNPDVDAIYRLLLPLPLDFRDGIRVTLGQGSWCPFNSQNTAFFKEAFPLLYLPTHCSFRMTDIWRSFVAQRICWENRWTVLFREATVRQFRNDHRLMQDFEDEVPGYLLNRRIAETLDALVLTPGVESIPDSLFKCYESMISLGAIEAGELILLAAWLDDIEMLSKRSLPSSDRSEGYKHHKL